MSESLFCPQCGTRNPVGYRFCGSCGTQRPEAVTTPDDSAAGASPSLKSDPAGRGRRGTATRVAASVMGLVCLVSLWTLLRPESDYSAAAYVEPALFHCTFSGVRYFDDEGFDSEWAAERSLDVGRGDWTVTGNDSDWGTIEPTTGTVVYDQGTDTLKIQAAVNSVRIGGLSALRFRDGTVLSVEYVSKDKDGDPPESLNLQMTFADEGTRASMSSDFTWGLPDMGTQFRNMDCSSQP